MFRLEGVGGPGYFEDQSAMERAEQSGLLVPIAEGLFARSAQIAVATTIGVQARMSMMPEQSPARKSLAALREDIMSRCSEPLEGELELYAAFEEHLQEHASDSPEDGPTWLRSAGLQAAVRLRRAQLTIPSDYRPIYKNPNSCINDLDRLMKKFQVGAIVYERAADRQTELLVPGIVGDDISGSERIGIFQGTLRPGIDVDPLDLAHIHVSFDEDTQEITRGAQGKKETMITQGPRIRIPLARMFEPQFTPIDMGGKKRSLFDHLSDRFHGTEDTYASNGNALTTDDIQMAYSVNVLRALLYERVYPE